MRQTHLNINFPMVRARIQNDDDMLLIGLSVGILSHYRSGALHHVCTKRVMEVMNCSYSVARRALSLAKQSRFFRYDAERHILSTTTMKNRVARWNKKGKKYYGNFVIEMRRDELRTMKYPKLKAVLRTYVELNCIKQKMNVDRLNCENKSEHPSYATEVPLSYIAKAVGISMSTVSRDLSKVSSTKLYKCPFKLYTRHLSDVRNGYVEKDIAGLKHFVDEKKCLVFFFEGCRYAVMDNSIKFKIWHLHVPKKNRERSLSAMYEVEELSNGLHINYA